MTLSPDKIGDKGQRFEIRYRENNGELPYKVLGWSASRRGALVMVKSWKTKPEVTHCWLYDRQEHQERQERGCISDTVRKALSAAPAPKDPTAAAYDAAVRPGHWLNPKGV